MYSTEELQELAHLASRNSKSGFEYKGKYFNSFNEVLKLEEDFENLKRKQLYFQSSGSCSIESLIKGSLLVACDVEKNERNYG